MMSCHLSLKKDVKLKRNLQDLIPSIYCLNCPFSLYLSSESGYCVRKHIFAANTASVSLLDKFCLD